MYRPVYHRRTQSVWYYPNEVYGDKGLLAKTKYVKSDSDFGKAASIALFTGSKCLVRRSDGALVTATTSPYPLMLYDLVSAGQWDKATRLCRFIKVWGGREEGRGGEARCWGSRARRRGFATSSKCVPGGRCYICSSRDRAWSIPIIIHTCPDNCHPHLCEQDPTIWAALAAMAMANKELSTAEVAFAAIDEVDKLHFVIKVSARRVWRLGRLEEGVSSRRAIEKFILT